MLLISASVLAVTHYFAIELYLYWIYPWFDMVTHTLGGAVVVLGYISISDFIPSFKSTWQKFIPATTFVLLIAISWELFEVWAGIPLDEPGYLLDTASDLILGLVGGTIGYLVASRLKELEV